jgi:hypothetical protein
MNDEFRMTNDVRHGGTEMKGMIMPQGACSAGKHSRSATVSTLSGLWKHVKRAIKTQKLNQIKPNAFRDFRG